MKQYFIKIYGCAMNTADAEKVAAWYDQREWKPAKIIEEANEVVIVTCSVRQTAEDRVYGFINNLSKIKSQKSKVKNASKKLKVLKPKIILTGCMLRYPLKWLKDKMPDVDEFKNISDFSHNSLFPPSLKLRRVGIIHNSTSPALVSIMEGCNNFCSYCVVPYARGREISRPMREIICEVEELAKRGYKKITLLGQNVNSYNKSSKFKIQSAKLQCKVQNFKTPFAQLLFELHEIDGIEKISFLTSNPWDLNDEIIEAMKLPKIDRYLHLPVQSGDDAILRKMNRHYSVDNYLELVGKIRKAIPDITIGTDIIVGFPGETEEQFNNTVLLCRKVGFIKAYVSMYSPRLQTAAYKLTDDIPHKEKRRRWKILDDLIKKCKDF